MKSEAMTFGGLQVTNQCVVVCDLHRWTSPESPSWFIINGTQDEVGREIAPLLEQSGVGRIDDFGGVCETFILEAGKYRDHPPLTKDGAAVFSFTPKKRIATEGLEMARSCKAAGFALLILTVQKHDKFGMTALSL